MTTNMRKDLSAPGLLQTVKSCFEQVPDPLDTSQTNIPLADCLMSGVALFGLKFPSLLQFDQSRDDEIIKHNLKTLYHIDSAPCDTYLRQRLDAIPLEFKK